MADANWADLNDEERAPRRAAHQNLTGVYILLGSILVVLSVIAVLLFLRPWSDSKTDVVAQNSPTTRVTPAPTRSAPKTEARVKEFPPPPAEKTAETIQADLTARLAKMREEEPEYTRKALERLTRTERVEADSIITVGVAREFGIVPDLLSKLSQFGLTHYLRLQCIRVAQADPLLRDFLKIASNDGKVLLDVDAHLDLMVGFGSLLANERKLVVQFAQMIHDQGFNAVAMPQQVKQLLERSAILPYLKSKP